MAYDEDDGDDDAMMRMLMICFVLTLGLYDNMYRPTAVLQRVQNDDDDDDD